MPGPWDCSLGCTFNFVIVVFCAKSKPRGVEHPTKKKEKRIDMKTALACGSVSHPAGHWFGLATFGSGVNSLVALPSPNGIGLVCLENGV